MKTQAEKMAILAEHKGPKSICKCGHLGDINHGSIVSAATFISVHGGFLGHGRCLYDKCKCDKFTWTEYTPEVLEKIDND